MDGDGWMNGGFPALRVVVVVAVAVAVVVWWVVGYQRSVGKVTLAEAGQALHPASRCQIEHTLPANPTRKPGWVQIASQTATYT